MEFRNIRSCEILAQRAKLGVRLIQAIKRQLILPYLQYLGPRMNISDEKLIEEGDHSCCMRENRVFQHGLERF